MTQTIYTIGYTGRKPAQLKALAEKLDATIFDIRFSPRSRNPQWTRKRLTDLLGDRYRHVKALGNRNYKGGPIDLVDYEAGRAAIEASDRPVILMCVCSDPDHCHRTTVANRLRAEGFEVTEIEGDLSSGPAISQLKLM